MNARNYLRPSEPNSILIGNFQYVFDRKDRSLDMRTAKQHNITRVYMTYETFMILHKNSFKTAQLLLPAPKIAGLLPAPKPVTAYTDVTHERYTIGQIIAIDGISQTCEITRIFTHASIDGTWITARHPYGVTTRKLSEIGE